MAKPLDQRIAAALGASARAATVSSLIDEVQDAMQACQAEHDRLDALSKSATAAEDEADDAADQVFKLSRKLVRLAAKRDQLQARHDELMTSERRERAVAEHEAVMARRDALVEDLKERVPQIFAELVDLFQRIQDSDAECDAINRSGGTMSYGLPWLDSAEAIARAVPGNFFAQGAPVMRLAQIKLPSFRPDGALVLAWPIDRELAQRQRIQAEELRIRQEAQAKKQADGQRWKLCIVTPPDGNAASIPVTTFRGKERLQRQPKQCRMTDEGIADAKAKGCDVQLLAPGQSLGMPASAAVF